MPKSEGIKEIVNKTAVQAATVVMMTLTDVEAGPWLTPQAVMGCQRGRGTAEQYLKH